MKHENKLRVKTLVAAISVALCQTSIAMAEKDTGSKAKDEIEVITVSATGRIKTTAEIPYNVSAVSGEELKTSNIVGETDLLRVLSGVTVIDRGARNSGGTNSIVVRGINVDSGSGGDNAANTTASVATYVGNTPIYANFVLKDVNRVEILRGPQGTLYGSGALGGTLRLIPNDPDTSDIYGSLSADLGQTNGSEGNNSSIDAMLNLPLSDTFAVRGHIGRIDNDGVIDYVNAYQLNEFGEPLINDGTGNCLDPRASSTPDSLIVGNIGATRDSGAAPIGAACFEEREDADTVEITHGRIAAMWKPSDSFNMLFAYQFQDDDIGARTAVTPDSNGQPIGSDLYFEYGDDDIGFALVEPSEREVDLYSLDIEWDLGPATLTSNTSYYKHSGSNERDNGAFWASGDFVNLLYTGWARPAQRTEAGYKEDATTQELRLISKDDNSKFNWIVGAFYLDQSKQGFSNSFNPGMNNFAQACARTDAAACHTSGGYIDFPGFSGFAPYLFQPGVNLSENDFKQIRDEEFTEFALYGEASYKFTEKLEVTLGLRWYDNEASSTGTFGFPLVDAGAEGPAGDTDLFDLPATTLPETKQDENGVLFKVNMAYTISDEAMVYGTVSEGFRRGGVNTIQDTPGLSFDPITNLNGLQTFAKDTVVNYELGIKGITKDFSYTVAAFYLDWDDPQVNTAVQHGFLVAANASAAESYGLETEISGYIETTDMTYRLGYTWTQAEITEDYLNPQDDGITVDPRFDDVVVASKGSTLPGVSEHVFSFLLSKTWDVDQDYISAQINGYYQSESENFVSDTLSQQLDSFWLIGASAAYVMENLTFTLYVKNLTDEKASTGGMPCTLRCNDTGAYEGWYGNGNFEYIAQPRTIGLVATYEF